MQNRPGVGTSRCVVRKVEANNHGDPSTGLGCPRRHLLDLISTVSILVDEFVGSANSNLSANVVPLFACVQHAIVANLQMEKKQSFAALKCHVSHQLSAKYFPNCWQSKLMRTQSFTNVLLVTCGMPMFIQNGAPTLETKLFSKPFFTKGDLHCTMDTPMIKTNRHGKVILDLNQLKLHRAENIIHLDPHSIHGTVASPTGTR